MRLVSHVSLRAQTGISNIEPWMFLTDARCIFLQHRVQGPPRVITGSGNHSLVGQDPSSQEIHLNDGRDGDVNRGSAARPRETPVHARRVACRWGTAGRG